MDEDFKNLLKKVKVIAFDCDGVLFNTDYSNKAYYNNLLTTFEKPELSKEQFEFIHMHTVDEALAYLFEDKKTLKKVYELKQNISYDSYLKYMEMEPNLLNLLENIRPKYNTAIATNRTTTMNGVLETHNLKHLFEFVVTALDVNRPKPYPDCLIKILDYFAISSDEAVFIGDSELDEKAARSANVLFIAYKNPKLSADFYLNDFKELQTMLA